MSLTSEGTPTSSRSFGFPFRARTTSSTTTEAPLSHIPRKLNSLFQFNHAKVDDNNKNTSRQQPSTSLERDYKRRYSSDEEDSYSDNGTIQPGGGQYTLRVINPDPVSSESDDDDDDRGQSSLPRNSTTATAATATATSTQSPSPSRQFDIAPVHEEAPPLAFVTAFVTAVPSPTASSLSLGSNSHQKEIGESIPHSQASEQPSLSKNASSARPLSRRESKTLQESSSSSLPLDFLPPLDLLPLDFNHYVRASTSAGGHTTPRQIYERIVEEEDIEDERKTSQRQKPQSQESQQLQQSHHEMSNLITGEPLVQTPLPLSPEAAEINSQYLEPLNSVMKESVQSTPFGHVQKSVLTHSQRPLMPGDSGIVSSSLYGNRSVATTITTDSVLTSTMRSPHSKYTKASYSLTSRRDALKLYRDMAEKTNDPEVQLTYAKYLLEIAPLYISSRNATHRGYNKSSPLSIMGHDIVKRGRTSLSYTAGRLNTASSTSETMDHDKKGQALEEEGVRWIRRLAKEGVGEAAGMLASWIDEQKYGFKSNPAKALSLHEIAARQGRSESIFAVGEHLERQGQPKAALKYYKDASERGLVAAVQRLAIVMIHGQLGQRQNMSSGLDLLAQAAANATQDNPDPLFVFAQALSNTYPLADIPAELVQAYGGKAAALPAFEHAAELGHAGALAQLGTIYQQGLYDAPVNLEKSFKYYEKAAEKGNPDGMFGLSTLYNGGLRGPDDSPSEQQTRIERDVSRWFENNPLNEDLAFHWCQKAANMNHLDAIYLLGWYYEKGFGTPRDQGRANILYHRAANKGHEEAAQRLWKECTVKQHTVEQSANVRRTGHDSKLDSQTCTIM
ncbi:hypothetical protein BX666DRAFT_2029614 [Dichotomocladium elegans]|nr:hypothetical protein BX666DRAFT_2029614 [Dichotomocladium elegans]